MVNSLKHTKVDKLQCDRYVVITTSRDIYFVYNWDLFNNELRRERRGFMIFENSKINEANNVSLFEES